MFSGVSPVKSVIGFARFRTRFISTANGIAAISENIKKNTRRIQEF